MRIAIATSENGEQIATVKEYVDIKGKGQISHFIAELELIKLDLLELWEEWKDEDI